MNSKRDSDDIRYLLPLRVSDDLTVEEAALVDQCIRMDEGAKAEFDSYARCMELLRDTGAQPLPVDTRPSLWDRIEPRLGPAGRMRRHRPQWISTRTLMVACASLAIVAIYVGAPPRLGQDEPDMKARQLDVGVNLPLRGVALQVLDDKMMERLHLKQKQGVLVADVEEGSPADRAGILDQDVILSIDGDAVNSIEEFAEMASRMQPGTVVRLEIIRKGERIVREFKVPDNQSYWRQPQPSIYLFETRHAVMPSRLEESLRKTWGIRLTSADHPAARSQNS